MQRIIAKVFQGFVWIMLAGLLVQFYFAGMGLFGASSLELHENLGYLFWLLTPVLVVLALAGRLGWRLAGLSALLVVLTTVQVFLPHFRAGLPWIAALHPINALAMLGVSAVIARQGWLGAAGRSRTTGERSLEAN